MRILQKYELYIFITFLQNFFKKIRAFLCKMCVLLTRLLFNHTNIFIYIIEFFKKNKDVLGFFFYIFMMYLNKYILKQ